MNKQKYLMQAYQQFILDFGGKRVTTPYRINVPFQPDRRKYGKSDTQSLKKDTIEMARLKGFNLKNKSSEQIRQFMEENLLGIDCSGFAYWVLDYFLRKLGKGGMEKIGFPRASSTNVDLLTSNNFTVDVSNINLLKSGDLVKFGSEEQIRHCIVIIDNKYGEITYAHSSRHSKPPGVSLGKFKYAEFKQEFDQYSFSLQNGDGFKRLIALQ